MQDLPLSARLKSQEKKKKEKRVNDLRAFHSRQNNGQLKLT
jgi:hypothetical protein